MKTISSLLLRFLIFIILAVGVFLLFCESESMWLLILSKPVAIGMFLLVAKLDGVLTKLNNLNYNNNEYL